MLILFLLVAVHLYDFLFEKKCSYISRPRLNHVYQISLRAPYKGYLSVKNLTKALTWKEQTVFSPIDLQKLF